MQCDEYFSKPRPPYRVERTRFGLIVVASLLELRQWTRVRHIWFLRGTWYT